LVTIATEGKSL